MMCAYICVCVFATDRPADHPPACSLAHIRNVSHWLSNPKYERSIGFYITPIANEDVLMVYNLRYTRVQHTHILCYYFCSRFMLKVIKRCVAVVGSATAAADAGFDAKLRVFFLLCSFLISYG